MTTFPQTLPPLTDTFHTVSIVFMVLGFAILVGCVITIQSLLRKENSEAASAVVLAGVFGALLNIREVFRVAPKTTIVLGCAIALLLSGSLAYFNQHYFQRWELRSLIREQPANHRHKWQLADLYENAFQAPTDAADLYIDAYRLYPSSQPYMRTAARAFIVKKDFSSANIVMQQLIQDNALLLAPDVQALIQIREGLSDPLGAQQVAERACLANLREFCRKR